MTRRFRSTRKFDKQFKSLDNKTGKLALKTMDIFMKDPGNPTLRLKNIQVTNNYYEISVNMSVRIIVDVSPEGPDQINTFFIIGTHEDVFPLK